MDRDWENMAAATGKEQMVIVGALADQILTSWVLTLARLQLPVAFKA